MHARLTPVESIRSMLLNSLLFFALGLNLHATSLGPVGGDFEVASDPSKLKVTGVTAGGPGALAGLQVGDYIYNAFDEPFTAITGNWVGSVKEYGDALERAEAGDGMLPLTVFREGVGNVSLNIQLASDSAFGPAYPLGSTKFNSMYEESCAAIHSQVAPSDGNIGYNTGLYGLVLLAHPNWNDETGAKPYRLSINKLRDRTIAHLNAAVLAPVEAHNDDGTPNDGSENDSNPHDQSYVNVGLENWDLCTSAMFIAEYRRKAGDTSVDTVVQRAADILANRVQTNKQPNGPTLEGLMGHGGVIGDYGHAGWLGLNIINAQAVSAMAMCKGAGATVNDSKFQSCWRSLRVATHQGGGYDDGNVGYWQGVQGGWDSSGRTAGSVFGLENYGGLSAADRIIVDKQKAYITRAWERMQDAHAYTVGGVFLTQFALPYLDDRSQRHVMENLKYFYQFHRDSQGGLTYFAGRANNGGDSYLGLSSVARINVGISHAVQSGNLPSFPAVNNARIHAEFKAPTLTWPALEARKGIVKSSSTSFNVNITDYLGATLNAADYTAAWTHVSGPATATFTTANLASTGVSFPVSGLYRIQLVVTKGGYTLTEPIDLEVTLAQTPSGYTAGSVDYRVYQSISGVNVADLTGSAKYPASPDIISSLTSLEGTHSGDNFGSRMQGYIIPQTTGDYTFYIASDDASEFKFGTTEALATKICEVTTYSAQYGWTENASQSSTAQSLTAGVPYFFEVNHKEGTGGDNLAVAWSGPGVSSPTVISSTYLAVKTTANALIGQPTNQSVAAGATATMSVQVSGQGPFLYEWFVDGASYWPASLSSSFILNNVGAGAAGTYHCKITTPTGTLTSNTATLTVTGLGVLTQGGLWQEVYESIGGSSVADMTSSPLYPRFPESGGALSTTATENLNKDSYGQRWSGWIKPDVTGDYIFHLAADDSSELWLSTTDQPTNKVKITSLGSATGEKAWSSGTQSSAISLIAGNRYYIELLHKEGGGGDHCAITWRKPGEAAPVDGSGSIAAQYLEHLTGGIFSSTIPMSLGRGAPTVESIRIRPNLGLALETIVTPGINSTATVAWVKQSGPGTVTFEDSSKLVTGATFSAEGSYGLRCTVNNGVETLTQDVTVVVSSSAIVEPQTYGPVVDAGSGSSIDASAAASLSGTATDDGAPATPGALTTTWSKLSGPGDVTFGDASAAATTANFGSIGSYVLRLSATDGETTTYDDVAITVTSSVTVSSAVGDSAAAEVAADIGSFIITRTGATTSALTVNLSLTGTAINGTDFATTAATVEIPIGSSSATVTITPLVDSIYEGDEAVQLAVTLGAYQIGTSTGAVTITDKPDNDADGLTDSWEVTHFGNITSSNGSGDADGDGVSDSLEFTSGTNPKNSDSDYDGFNDKLETTLGTSPADENSTPPAEYNGLHGWWKLDETAGVTAVEESLANDGVVSGGTWVAAHKGNGLQLDGVDDRLLMGTDASLTGTTPFTLSIWVKTSDANGGMLLQQRDGSSIGTRGQYGLSVNGNGTVQFYIYNSGYQFNITSSAVVNDNQWHHVVAVRDGADGYIYVDGNLSAQGNGPELSLYPLNVAAGFDYRDNASYLAGTIDDIRIYSRALSNADALNLIDNSRPVVTAATFSIAENVATSSAVGTVTKTDVDGADTHTYAITGGNTGNAFQIDGFGNITTLGALDHETLASYSLTVSVTDNGTPRMTGSETITVNISDINEAPTASSVSGSIAENTSIGTALTVVSVSDQDTGNTFSYAFTSGNDDGVFGIDANGVISTLKALDFETTQQYQLVVRVTDQGGLTGSTTITVDVTNVVEGTNLALGINHATAAGAVATQSSTAHSGSASRAIDGNTDGTFGNASVTHTDSAASGAVWWQVDLGQDRAMHSIKLFNRASIQSRLSNFTISILDSSSSVVASQNFYVGSGNAGSSETWALPSAVTGRVVRVELIGGLNNDGNNVLSLAEVQVLGGGVASQSTTDSGGDASRAIDNNTNGVWANGSVTHTDSSSANWWEVQLDQFSVIEQLSLYNRTDAGVENRLSNFRVTLWQGATQVYSSNHFTQSGTYSPANYLINDLNGTVADRVRIESLGINSAGDRVISLAEVQVFGEFLTTADADSDGDKLKDIWELSHYGHLGATSDTADTDGDGYNSFKEMAFGTDPTVGTNLNDHMTSSIIDDGGTDKLELKFRRPTNHAALGLVYQLKSSANLSAWVNDTTPATATTPDADGVTEWISYRFDPSNAAKKFIQLQATPANE